MDKESRKEPIEKCLLLMDKAVDNGFKETTAFCNPPKIMAMMA